MAYNGIDKAELLRETRNLLDEVDQSNSVLTAEGVYTDGNERLAEFVNLTLDEINQKTGLADRDTVFVASGGAEREEFELPDDLYDIQSVEDQSGGYKYPMIEFTDRRFARIGYAWTESGYGLFGPYIRGNRIGFDPPMAPGEHRRLYYFGHPGKYGLGFGPAYAGVDQGNGTTLDVLKKHNVVTIKNFTGNAATVANYIKKNNVISIRIMLQLTSLAGINYLAPDYDHYLVSDIVDISGTDVSLLLHTDYKRGNETGLSYSIGDKITAPNVAKNTIIYGTLNKIGEMLGVPALVTLYGQRYRDSVNTLANTWSRWQNQTQDVIRTVM